MNKNNINNILIVILDTNEHKAIYNLVGYKPLNYRQNLDIIKDLNTPSWNSSKIRYLSGETKLLLDFHTQEYHSKFSVKNRRHQDM